MRIILAEKAGFCFGVERAVSTAYSLAEKGVKAKTLGPLIHNTDVIRDLEEKGIGIIDSPEQARKDETVIIRAHGVSPDVYAAVCENAAEVCDATCPFVKKIHAIVADNSREDIPVFIAGDPEHPEVQGIKGYCKGPVYIFRDAQELENILKTEPQLCNIGIIFVSQTTFSENEWKKSLKIINKYCTNEKIFDTICGATRERQAEAESLAQKCDAVVVIGGRHSSNTAKLQNVCSRYCDTFLVERADELKNIDFSTYAEVGVTAGASTPRSIIKEVLTAMSDINENVNNQVEEVPSEATSNDQSFANLLEQSLANMNNNQKVIGTVMGITPTEIQVDIGRKQAGFVPLEEYSSDPNANPAEELKVGDEIELIIMKTNDAEGTMLLSKKRADAQKSWGDIVEAKENGDILEGTVTAVIKGGVLVSTKGSIVFIPASLATERRDDSLEDLVKKTVKFRIIDVDPARQRAVGSVRAILSEQKKAASDAFWADAEEGKVYTGTVKSLTNFGAFVDIGGVDGMVHISEMSWKRIKHPSEVFSVGQEVEVYIKALDRENRKISLGYRKDEDNPWAILKKTYPEGSIVEAEIVGLTAFGAFARVIPGIDGLIHISQIANRRINSPGEVLKVGEKVTCKITAIDYDKKRVSLSIRALLPEEEYEDEAPADEAGEEAAPEAAAEEAPAEAEAVVEEAAEEVAEVAEEAAAEAEAVAEEAAEEVAEAAEEAAAEAEAVVEETAEEVAEAAEEAASEAEAVVEEAAEEVAEAAEEAADAADDTAE